MSKWKPCYMIKDEPVTIPMDLLIEVRSIWETSRTAF